MLAGCFALAVTLFFVTGPAARYAAGLSAFRSEAEMLIVAASGAAVYGVVLLAGLAVAGLRLRRL